MRRFIRSQGHVLPLPARSSEATWSPYGLEAHRVALLQRRAGLLKAAILLGLLLVLGSLVFSVRDDPLISTIDGNGNTVDIQVPTGQPRAKPTTLSVAPGRTTVLDQPIQPEARPPRDRSSGDKDDEGLRINWIAVLMNFGPPIGAAFYAWRYGKERVLGGGMEQVNFGVYKGAMPLELVTAQHKRFVFTRKEARASLFGKARADHLPAQPVVLARGGPGAAQPLPAAAARGPGPQPPRPGPPGQAPGRFQRLR